MHGRLRLQEVKPVANDIQGLDAVNAALRNLTKVAPQAALAALKDTGQMLVHEAFLNAPKSPMMKKHSATLKRKKRTAQGMLPGGLERSIEYEASETRCSIFVASDSEAKAYAKRIHDEKGVTWRNRGPATIDKGARADDKFIERAIRDNLPKIQKAFDDELRKALPK